MKNEGKTTFNELNKVTARLEISYTINAQNYLNTVEQSPRMPVSQNV